MTEFLFSFISSCGVYSIFAAAFLSCLALPVPTSLLMLSGGAFVASGDMELWAVLSAAFVGAVLGDQTGYFIGRTGGTKLVQRLSRSPARAAVLQRARDLVDRRGMLGVFLSTWAVAPLGPWVNFIAGASGLSWRRFTVGDVAGEAIWVMLYVGLGYIFMDSVAAISSIMSDVVGLVVAVVVAAGCFLWIRGVLRNKQRTVAGTAA